MDLIAEGSQDIVGIHVERFCLASHTLLAKAGHIVSLYVSGQGHNILFPREGTVNRIQFTTVTDAEGLEQP